MIVGVKTSSKTRFKLKIRTDLGYGFEKLKIIEPNIPIGLLYQQVN